jgi:hypothetical protein
MLAFFAELIFLVKLARELFECFHHGLDVVHHFFLLLLLFFSLISHEVYALYIGISDDVGWTALA